MRPLSTLAAVILLSGGLGAGFLERTGEAAQSKGVGPITNITLGALDPILAEKGKHIFEQKCTACHKFEERYVGPALAGVTGRRSPEWIMNMILNPQGMTDKDPVARELLGTYMTQMTFQNVSAPDARALLEYLRSVEPKKGGKAGGTAEQKKGAKK